MKDIITRFYCWLRGKGNAPLSLAGPQWTGSSFLDSYRRLGNPTPNELMAELKGTAWACASLNASVCASFPPRLYVATQPGQPRPRCLTRPLTPTQHRYLVSRKDLPASCTKAANIQEILDHPLLTLLGRPNPHMSAFDLWELTQFYLEVHGKAFWKLDFDPVLGIPSACWVLPAQNIRPMRRADSRNLIDYYEYQGGAQKEIFQSDDIIFFRYPDPRNPYLDGISPLRAAFEQVALLSDYHAMKKAIYDNRGTPDALITPAEVIGEEERTRLEAQLNAKFRRGGRGRLMVAESPMKVQIFEQSMGDLKQLAESRATKEDVCNAFAVPIAYFTSNTNMANLAASEQQHTSQAISPRLKRRDEKLNAELVPLYDPSGRLFLASEDPIPLNFENNLKELEIRLKYGLVTIDEVRQADGLPPVPWGGKPWFPSQWEQAG